MQAMKVGIIGCGNISSQYLDRAKQFPGIEIAACADLDLARAKAQAEKYGCPKACSVEELLADTSIELVVNLTIPAAHADVALKAIDAGKHIYSEKPLSLTREEGRSILDAAKAKGVRVGNAPDTFLGTSHQTCRKLIEEGAIGKPVAATAFMLCPGHESWHPDPEFYYKVGGGPMLDMGPYYLTALINLLGPITQVAGHADIMINPRTITSEPKNGTKVDVETPDHVTGTLRFAEGAIGTIVTSFATHFNTTSQPITIYGTGGTLKVPDPNGFDGQISIRKVGDEDWSEVPAEHTHPNGRSLGVADMAHAIRTGRDHRASGEQAFAVLDAMLGFLDSSESGKYHSVAADYAKPALMPTGLADGVLDD